MQPLKTNYDTFDILLIDDDVDEHYLVASFLSDMGLHKKLLSLDSGEKAIRYLATLPPPDFPSLIFLDYHMPCMNGKEVLQYFKSTYRYTDIPVIVRSSEMNENMKSDLLKIGAAACFTKTFDMQELKIFLSAMAVIVDNKAYNKLW